MNFELDQDYFNRAGNKVRYVGTAPAWGIDAQLIEYMFRKKDGSLYGTRMDGKFSTSSIVKHDFDVISK